MGGRQRTWREPNQAYWEHANSTMIGQKQGWASLKCLRLLRCHTECLAFVKRCGQPLYPENTSSDRNSEYAQVVKSLLVVCGSSSTSERNKWCSTTQKHQLYCRYWWLIKIIFRQIPITCLFQWLKFGTAQKKPPLLTANTFYTWFLLLHIYVGLFSPQLIFEKEGVYLHTNAKRSNQDTSIPGFIRIVERVRKSVWAKTV